MKQRLFFLFAMLLPALVSLGADKQAKQPKQPKLSTIMKNAKTAIKNGSGQDNARKELVGTLSRPELNDKQRMQVHYLTALVDESLNGVENRKAYLKQAYDTARFFNKLRDMYDQLYLCDSIDQLPDDNGRIRVRMDKKTHALRHKHRRNILGGANFYLSKGDYKQAFPFYDLYCSYNCEEGKDTLFPIACQRAMLTAYAYENYQGALRYADPAIHYSRAEHAPILFEYKARSYRCLQNDSAFADALMQGVELYPDHDFFFVHLADIYHDQRYFQKEQELADQLIAATGGKALHFYAKSKSKLAQNDYEACIALADSTIQRDATFADAYYNKGIAYLNLAVIAQENSAKDARDPKYAADRSHVRELYQQARPCIEKVRELQPDNQDRWAAPLYRIYLNLNLGEQFSEIEKLLQNKK